MSNDPDPDVIATDVVEKMVREAIEIASTRAGSIEVKEARVRANLLHGRHKLREKVIRQTL
jgi:hypothetical protein